MFIARSISLFHDERGEGPKAKALREIIGLLDANTPAVDRRYYQRYASFLIGQKTIEERELGMWFLERWKASEDEIAKAPEEADPARAKLISAIERRYKGWNPGEGQPPVGTITPMMRAMGGLGVAAAFPAGTSFETIMFALFMDSAPSAGFDGLSSYAPAADEQRRLVAMRVEELRDGYGATCAGVRHVCPDIRAKSSWVGIYRTLVSDRRANISIQRSGNGSTVLHRAAKRNLHAGAVYRDLLERGFDYKLADISGASFMSIALTRSEPEFKGVQEAIMRAGTAGGKGPADDR